MLTAQSCAACHADARGGAPAQGQHSVGSRVPTVSLPCADRRRLAQGILYPISEWGLVGGGEAGGGTWA